MDRTAAPEQAAHKSVCQGSLIRISQVRVHSSVTRMSAFCRNSDVRVLSSVTHMSASHRRLGGVGGAPGPRSAVSLRPTADWALGRARVFRVDPETLPRMRIRLGQPRRRGGGATVCPPSHSFAAVRRQIRRARRRDPPRPWPRPGAPTAGRGPGRAWVVLG